MRAVDLLDWANRQPVEPGTGRRVLPLRDGRVARGVVLGATASAVLMDRGKVPVCLLRMESS